MKKWRIELLHLAMLSYSPAGPAPLGNFMDVSLVYIIQCIHCILFVSFLDDLETWNIPEFGSFWTGTFYEATRCTGWPVSKWLLSPLRRSRHESSAPASFSCSFFEAFLASFYDVSCHFFCYIFKNIISSGAFFYLFVQTFFFVVLRKIFPINLEL